MMLDEQPPSLWSKMVEEENAHAYQSLDLGGTIRRRSPEQTQAFLQPLLKKYGITRIADIGGLDVIGIPVATAIRPNAKHLCGAMGKGISTDLARISAIMESIECYHMEYPPEPTLFGSFAELSSQYPLLSPECFQASYGSTEPLSNLATGWVPTYSLLDKKTIYIPFILVNIESSRHHPGHGEIPPGLLFVSTNGLASGNTLNEAILHALCEVIERDSVYRWGIKSKAEQDETKLDLNSISSVINQFLISKVSAANIAIDIWDVSSDFQIPTFLCRIYDVDVHAGGISEGYGTHLSAEIALSRAITEAIQTRASYFTGSRDNLIPEAYERLRIDQKKIIQEHLTQNSKNTGKLPFSHIPKIKCSTSILENIETLMHILKQHHYEHVLVFENTSPEYTVPVVQVFVPGLKSLY